MSSLGLSYRRFFRSLITALTRELESCSRNVAEDKELQVVLGLLRNTSDFSNRVSLSQPSALQVSLGKHIAETYLNPAFGIANQHDQLVTSVKSLLHRLDEADDRSEGGWIAQYLEHPILKSRFAYRDIFVSESLLVGVNLLAPRTDYEAHRHAAKELYFPLVLHGPDIDASLRETQMDRRHLVHRHYDRYHIDDLSGTSQKTKQTSDGSWDPDRDSHGFVLYHNQNQPHGMKSTHYPLLNVWIQYGTNLRTDRTEFVNC